MKCYRLVPILLSLLLVQPVTADERTLRNRIALGALTFSDNCKQCHQLDGYGEVALYPSLHDPVLLADRKKLVRTILHGRVAPSTDGESLQQLMPSLSYLSNEEIASIVAFISNSWGEEVLMLSLEEIEAARR